MQESNNLTEKYFWNEGWRNIKLPARYFYSNYSHILISNLVQHYISGKNYKSFLEIGGCPGRWSDYFFTKNKILCDSMDYTKKNIDLTKKNYELLSIKGKVFLGDITKPEPENKKKYDIVLSDGLLEHFIDSSEIFKNHVTFLNEGGLLIVGVPNIKKSWFYNYFAKKDAVGYTGYRHISKEELLKHAKDKNLKVLFCDYVGVFNIGLVHSYALNKILTKLFVIISLFFDNFSKIFKIKKESDVFSPYIYLIAKK